MNGKEPPIRFAHVKSASDWSESFATDRLSDRCDHQRPFDRQRYAWSLQPLGQTVRLMAPKFVIPYLALRRRLPLRLCLK